MVPKSTTMLACGLLALLLSCVTGCSSEVANTGLVRFRDGEPVQSGSIEFRSVASGETFASRIDQKGEFALADRDGASAFPPGDYEVVVVQMVLTEDLAAEHHQHGRTVPRRYADYYTSGLRYSNDSARVDPVEIELEES
ncbi:MAG: carboxypeptidase regulatory-like domain-containing protein [Planctomycetota bacterium]